MEIVVKLAFKKINNNSKLLSKIISKYSNSKYYHSEIIIDDKWISSDIGVGVYINESPIYDSTEWDFITFDNIDITERDLNIIMSFIKKQDDKKYDYLGIILSQLLPFSLHSRNRYYCSELCTKILQLFLIEETLDLVPNTVSPGDLAKLFKLEK